MIRKELIHAAYDLQFLLNRAYPKASSLEFVGNRYQLKKRERMILFRALFPKAAVLARRAKVARLKDFKGNRLVIDGYNVTITLENAIKGRLLITCSDSFVRDVSGVFRKYRPSHLTRQAWSLVTALLKGYRPAEAVVILDRPMSQSGQLAGMIRTWLAEIQLEAEVRLSKTPERTMLAMEGIHCSADSFILDKAGSIFDLAGHIIRRRMKNVRLIHAGTLTRRLQPE